MARSELRELLASMAVILAETGTAYGLVADVDRMVEAWRAWDPAGLPPDLVLGDTEKGDEG